MDQYKYYTETYYCNSTVSTIICAEIFFVKTVFFRCFNKKKTSF